MGLIKTIFLVEMNTKDQIKKLGISGSLVIFVGAGILMHLQTKFVIPWLSRVTGMEIIIFWFVIGGLGIFLPLILLGMFLLKREGVWGEPGLWRERLRFRRMGRDEWVWSVVGVVAVSLLSGLVLKVCYFWLDSLIIRHPSWLLSRWKKDVTGCCWCGFPIGS